MMSSGIDLQTLFPQLQTDDYQITSAATRGYNCHAWAAGEDDAWWSPVNRAGLPIGGYYWPRGVPHDESLPALVQAFRTCGYAPCDTGELEVGLEKIAIYTDHARLPTHTARQLANGQWTSKIGEYQDITHDTLAGLEGQDYGRVACFMSRARTDAQ